MARSATRSPISTQRLVALGRAAGLAAVGVAPAEVLEPARAVLHLRKARGLAAEMQFTYRNPDRSTDPRAALPGARSLVAGALFYGNWTVPTTDVLSEHSPSGGAAPASLLGRVARYAWRDHYETLKASLRPIAEELEAAGHRTRLVADSNDLVDRNVAWSAGLGWYGKNSNLLVPGAGSWFVLGAVITDAELLPTGPPVDDGCGSCQQCIEDCPTGAIVAPGVIDARRCLAWLVQGPGPIPAEYRAAVGDRLYGCDDCQDVCPPNRAVGRASGPPARVVEHVDRAVVDLVWLLTASDEDILARHGTWYIAGRDVDVVRRTALVVLGNVAEPPDERALALVERYLGHANPLLRRHAIWAARRLGCIHLLAALAADEDVAAELAVDVEPRFEPGAWTG